MTWTTFDNNDPSTWPAADELVLVQRWGSYGLRSFHYEIEDEGTTVSICDESNDYDDSMEDARGFVWHSLPPIVEALDTLASNGIETGEQYQTLIKDVTVTEGRQP